jgi:hypothetical protein
MAAQQLPTHFLADCIFITCSQCSAMQSLYAKGATVEHGFQYEQMPSVGKTWSNFLSRVVLLAIALCENYKTFK